MEGNAFHAGIVQLIAKWELTYVGTRNVDKILFVPLAWDAVYVPQFARVEFFDLRMDRKQGV